MLLIRDRIDPYPKRYLCRLSVVQFDWLRQAAKKNNTSIIEVIRALIDGAMREQQQGR